MNIKNKICLFPVNGNEIDKIWTSKNFRYDYFNKSGTKSIDFFKCIVLLIILYFCYLFFLLCMLIKNHKAKFLRDQSFHKIEITHTNVITLNKTH